MAYFLKQFWNILEAFLLNFCSILEAFSEQFVNILREFLVTFFKNFELFLKQFDLFIKKQVCFWVGRWMGGKAILRLLTSANSKYETL